MVVVCGGGAWCCVCVFVCVSGHPQQQQRRTRTHTAHSAPICVGDRRLGASEEYSYSIRTTGLGSLQRNERCGTVAEHLDELRTHTYTRTHAARTPHAHGPIDG